MKELPTFRFSTQAYVTTYAEKVFGDKFVSVVSLPRNAYRALFAPNYFTLQPEQTEPSKSQWNTLKKRMKRIHGGVFVFKEHGAMNVNKLDCLYVDFGFLPDNPADKGD